MVDPVTQLAYAIQANPGGYVVLLGSGVSRAAGVPTAWEVVEQLIRRLPEVQETGGIDEPVNWYRQRYSDDIRFSSVLEQLAPHLSDRVNILHSIVGNPSPTESHKSLALLASSGHIDVFLTTNYDSLMETALYSRNLDPVVISSESAAIGVEPFHQLARPIVFKLHGDFNHPDSMLATDLELSSYRHGIRRLLKRTIEDYGLVVVGWSGEHDVALRRAIQAVRSRRYPLWLIHRGTLKVSLREIRDARDAFAVASTDADQFFSDLEQKVAAITTYRAPHPQTVGALSAQLKLLLAESASPLAVYELVSKEAESCYRQLTDRERFPYSLDGYSSEEYDRRAVQTGRDYLSVTTAAAHIMAIGCAWTGHDHHDIWKRALERIANLPVIGPGEPITHTFLRELRNFPWMLMLYSGSIAAISRSNLDIIRILCRNALVRGDYNTSRIPLIAAEPLAYFCCENRKDKQLLSSMIVEMRGETSHGNSPFLAPVSEALFVAAREPVRHLIPDDDEYEEYFGRAELLFNLIAGDVVLTGDSHQGWTSLSGREAGPWPGRYSRRTRSSSPSMIELARNEMSSDSPFWRAVDIALFDDDGNRREAALTKIVERLPGWAASGFRPRYGM